MNIVFYVFIILISLAIYFMLSFLFGSIGSIAVKLAKIFKSNITDEKEKIENE